MLRPFLGNGGLSTVLKPPNFLTPQKNLQLVQFLDATCCWLGRFFSLLLPFSTALPSEGGVLAASDRTHGSQVSSLTPAYTQAPGHVSPPQKSSCLIWIYHSGSNFLLSSSFPFMESQCFLSTGGTVSGLDSSPRIDLVSFHSNHLSAAEKLPGTIFSSGAISRKGVIRSKSYTLQS